LATQSLDKQKHFYVAGHTYYRATRLLSLCDDRPGQDRCLLSPQAQGLGQNAKWQISTASSCCSCMFLDKKVSSPWWLIREGAWGCRVIPVPTLTGHQGPWGYTLSLGRYEALHLHFNGQDNEKKEEHNRQACVGTIEDPLRPPSLGGTPGAGGSNGTDTRL